MTSNSKELKILLSDNGVAPYSEFAPGDILSTFNFNVRSSYFKVGSGFEILPNIISKWYWNKNEKSYTFELDPRFKFHDGSQPTIEDLEFSLLRGFFSEKRTFYEIYLGNIKGIEKVVPGQKFSSGLVEGIKIISKNELKVFLLKPNPAFLYSLTRPFFSLTSSRFYKPDLMTWKSKPIGVGNYFVESEDSEKITLKRFANSSKFDKVFLYTKSSVNVKYDISYLSEQISNEKIYYTNIPVSVSTLFFNIHNELSKDINFRKSLYYGLNRESLVNGASDRKPSYEFLTSTYWANKELKNPFNLKLAKEYASKVSTSLKKKKWIVPVFSSTDKFNKRTEALNSLLTAQLKEIGYDISFYPDKNKFKNLETTKNSPFVRSGRICDNLDPLLMFGSFRSNSAYKYENSQYDEKFDELYDLAATAASAENRVKTLRELSLYTIKHVFMIPLFEDKNSYYYNSNSILSFGDQQEPTTINFDLIETLK